MENSIHSNTPDTPSPKKAGLLIAIAILSFFVALYCLSYSGTYTTDDEHILTSRSVSIAFDEQFNQSRVIGNSRVFDYSIVAALQAEQVANIEPVQGILGSLLAKFSVLLDVGRIQTMFLLNIWVTAFTAMVIYLTARKREYSNRVAITLSVLFGLCTIAFPYSKTYFRDPLAMCFITCTWFFSSSIQFQDKSSPKWVKIFHWSGFVVTGVLGVLSKNSVLIAIPVLLLEIVYHKWFNRKKKVVTGQTERPKIWLIIAGILIVLLSFWFFVVPKIPMLARATPQYYFSLLIFFFTTPHPNMIHALTGPFISPGKSIFVFSPVLLFSIVSLFYRPKKSWTGWCYLILLVIAQALFYDDEWSGHINWGLRYVLPSIPALVLSSAPLVEKLLDKKIGKTIVITLALISCCVQIIGTTVPVRTYFNQKATANPPVTELSMIWDFDQSQIFWGIDWIWSGSPLDFAIGRTQEGSLLLFAGIFLITLLASLVFLNSRYRYLSMTTPLAAIGVNILMLFIYKNDPAALLNRIDLIQSQEYISSRYREDDLILLKCYGTPSWTYWMNWTSPDLLWTSLPFFFPAPDLIEQFNQSQNPMVVMDRISIGIMEKEVIPGRRVWLVLPGDTPGADLGMEEKWLQDRSSSNSCWDFPGDLKTTKLCYYEID